MRVSLSQPYCVYHHSLDGTVFYVGMGRLSRSLEGTTYRRRNSKWGEIVSKRGYFDTAIVRQFADKISATRFEVAEIERLHPEANFIHNGYMRTNEQRQELRRRNIGHAVSTATREKLSIAFKGRSAPWASKPCSKERKKFLSELFKGRPSPMKGRTHSAGTIIKIKAAQRETHRILDLADGSVYDSQNQAARKLRLPMGSLSRHLRGLASHVKGQRFQYVTVEKEVSNGPQAPANTQ